MPKTRPDGSRIVMVGCLEAGWEVINRVLSEGMQIDWIVTIDEETARKNKVSGYRSFDDLGKKYGIPVYHAVSYALKTEQDLAFFREHQFDLLIQGGWQRLFPEEMLQTLRVGAIGIHGSADFLPAGRGRSPINWSLIEGKKRFILHFFLMKPGADDGDIFHFEMFDINEWDNCKTLYYKNAMLTGKAYLQWVGRLISGDYTLMEQKGTPSYYPKRTEEDGLVNWNQSVFQIYDLVRAITHPYPGAFSFIQEKRVNIWKAQPFDTRISYFAHPSGEIVEVFDNGDFVVNCNGGLLLVTEYQTELRIERGMTFGNKSN